MRLPGTPEVSGFGRQSGQGCGLRRPIRIWRSLVLIGGQRSDRNCSGRARGGSLESCGSTGFL
jgi:hypothetical protein